LALVFCLSGSTEPLRAKQLDLVMSAPPHTLPGWYTGRVQLLIPLPLKVRDTRECAYILKVILREILSCELGLRFKD